MVWVGLVSDWRLAIWPTRRSPREVKATIDGVVRAPSRDAMTRGFPPSITAMQQFVVPRSMPITLPMSGLLLVVFGRTVSGIVDANADHRGPQDAVVEEITSLEHVGHRLRGKRRVRI